MIRQAHEIGQDTCMLEVREIHNFFERTFDVYQ